ncbi:MAG: hypothetical protein AAF206_02240 [Bacteroidota bacterium]
MSTQFPADQYEALPSNIDGITVFKQRKQEAEHRQIVSFNCPNCGGTQAYSTEDGMLCCTYCSHLSPPPTTSATPSLRTFVSAPAVHQKHEFKLDTLEEAAESWAPGNIDLDCQTCGAHVTLPPQQLSHVCPFCHSTHVIEQKRRDDALSPQALIPFCVEPSSCAAPARAWMSNHWLVPKDAKEAIREEAFRMVYVPYWVFDADAHAVWKAEVGYTYTSTDGEGNVSSHTQWKWKRGTKSFPFQNVLVSGSDHLDKQMLRKLSDFSLEGLVPYGADFLAGIPAQAYEVKLEDAWQIGRGRIRETMKIACKKAPGKNKIRNFSMEMKLSDETWKYILLPYILSSYHYDGKDYQIMVNGQTGDIAGYRPVDRKKLNLYSLLAFVPGLLIMLFTLMGGAEGEMASIIGLVGLVAGGIAAFSFHKTAQALQG